MNEERLYKVIRRAHTTEKSTHIAGVNQLAFEVLKDANKGEVKRAIEKLFSVEVQAVRVLNVKGKEKHFKQRVGRRSDWKKVYVSLKKGSKIDLANLTFQ